MVLMLSAALVVTGSCRQSHSSVEKKPIEVKTLTLHATPVAARQHFSGTIEEESGSALSFPVAGTVKSVAVAAGQQVQKGQLIAVLDDASFRSSLEMAKAALEQAKDAYQRLKQLHDNNSLPDIQWVEAESKLKQAQSAYDISRKNMEDTRLYAPFSGYISEKQVEVGNNVMPSSPVVKLVTVDKVKVCISVPETEISGIHPGVPIEIEVPALNHRLFTGKIREKGVSANALSRSYEVKAEIPNAQHALLPGMLCTLNLTQSTTTSVVLVPCSVVQLDSSNQHFVWVVQQGKAVRRTVGLGQFEGDSIAVVSGLSEGEQLIVEGQQKISDNMQVKVMK